MSQTSIFSQVSQTDPRVPRPHRSLPSDHTGTQPQHHVTVDAHKVLKSPATPAPR